MTAEDEVVEEMRVDPDKYGWVEWRCPRCGALTAGSTIRYRHAAQYEPGSRLCRRLSCDAELIRRWRWWPEDVGQGYR